VNVVKHLNVQLAGQCEVPAVTLTTTVPTGATASITVPTMGAPAATCTVTEVRPVLHV
jgi:hypothetical protein